MVRTRRKRSAVDHPALRHDRHLVAGAKLLEPYQQGEFDGLCGLYAAINGIGLLASQHRPLTAVQCQGLYRRGIEIVQGEGRLPFAAAWGISQTLWRRLVEDLCASASRRARLRIKARRPFVSTFARRRDVLATIEQAIDNGHPVLVALLGTYFHYTVICGYTPRRLILFDSYAYSWIDKASCAVTGEKVAGRHQIATRSLMIIAAE